MSVAGTDAAKFARPAGDVLHANGVAWTCVAFCAAPPFAALARRAASKSASSWLSSSRAPRSASPMVPSFGGAVPCAPLPTVHCPDTRVPPADGSVPTTAAAATSSRSARSAHCTDDANGMAQAADGYCCHAWGAPIPSRPSHGASQAVGPAHCRAAAASAPRARTSARMHEQAHTPAARFSFVVPSSPSLCEGRDAWASHGAAGRGAGW